LDFAVGGLTRREDFSVEKLLKFGARTRLCTSAAEAQNTKSDAAGHPQPAKSGRLKFRLSCTGCPKGVQKF